MKSTFNEMGKAWARAFELYGAEVKPMVHSMNGVRLRLAACKNTELAGDVVAVLSVGNGTKTTVHDFLLTTESDLRSLSGLADRIAGLMS